MPQETRQHGPARPRSIIERLRSAAAKRHGSQAPGHVTAHTLVLGDRTEHGSRVDARVVASAGYRAGLCPGQPGLPASPGTFITNAANSAQWQQLHDLAVLPVETDTPTIRFQSRSGQAMSTTLRATAQRTTKILVLADETAWQTVVLITDAANA